MEKRLDEVIDSLEKKLGQLMADYSKLNLAYMNVQEALVLEKFRSKNLEEKSSKLVEQNKILKNAILGSDEYKRETKLKINALVKEIDQCIAQLS